MAIGRSMSTGSGRKPKPKTRTQRGPQGLPTASKGTPARRAARPVSRPSTTHRAAPARSRYASRASTPARPAAPKRAQRATARHNEGATKLPRPLRDNAPLIALLLHDIEGTYLPTIRPSAPRGGLTRPYAGPATRDPKYRKYRGDGDKTEWAGSYSPHGVRLKGAVIVGAGEGQGEMRWHPDLNGDGEPYYIPRKYRRSWT